MDLRTSEQPEIGLLLLPRNPVGMAPTIARWRHGCGRLGGEYPHPSSPGRLSKGVIAGGDRQLQPQGELQVGRVIAGELEPQSQAQQGGRLGRGGIDADWQQGHLIHNLASCNQGAWASTTGSRPAIASL